MQSFCSQILVGLDGRVSRFCYTFIQIRDHTGYDCRILFIREARAVEELTAKTRQAIKCSLVRGFPLFDNVVHRDKLVTPGLC